MYQERLANNQINSSYLNQKNEIGNEYIYKDREIMINNKFKYEKLSSW